MAGRKKARNQAAARRRLAASAERREKHAKLVVDRHEDPRFIHHTRTATGRTISWDPQSEAGHQLQELLLNLRAAFIEKFGREPGPDDPIFFDPNADEPVPYPESEMWAHLSAAVDEPGLEVEQAFVRAAAELGYLVTESNQHLFTAMEVEAFDDAVRRALGEPPAEDDGAEEDEDVALDATLAELAADAADGLELVVAQTLLDGGDEKPALNLVENLLTAMDGMDGEEAVALARPVFECLNSWLEGAAQRGISSAAVVNWVNTHLSEAAASTAVQFSGILGYPFAPNLAREDVSDELLSRMIAGMIWLAAGVVATGGGGDAHWLRQFDQL